MSPPTPCLRCWRSSPPDDLTFRGESACATGWPRWSGGANVVMVLAMSGEPNQNAEPKDASAQAGADGELPVEVVPPERAGRNGAPGNGQDGHPQAQVI